jgi:hypothetical protein
MKKIFFLLAAQLFFMTLFAQSNGSGDAFQRANNAVNKVSNIIAVFQPYLLKARQIFYDVKQMAGDVKNSAKNTFGKNGAVNNTGGTYSNTSYPSTYTDQTNNNNQNGYNTVSNNQPTSNTGNGYNGGTANTNANGYDNNANYSNNNNSNSTSTSNGTPNAYSNNTTGYNNSSSNGNSTGSNVQYYLPSQSLPVNNPATVNNDGTGNWGNQNNGLYGNCLDVLTGTVMGLGEAETAPKSVDVIFVTANGSYQLWTPNYARNEVAAQYTSRSTTESATKWSDVNETEIAQTRVTISQFDQIQNNNQILNVVKNAQNYGSSITEFSKMDGKVYAVKAELEDRTVYGLIAVVKQVGTDGSNGYLKIKIKAQGVGNNGQLNANAYLR